MRKAIFGRRCHLPPGHRNVRYGLSSMWIEFEIGGVWGTILFTIPFNCHKELGQSRIIFTFIFVLHINVIM